MQSTRNSKNQKKRGLNESELIQKKSGEKERERERERERKTERKRKRTDRCKLTEEFTENGKCAAQVSACEEFERSIEAGETRRYSAAYLGGYF